MKSDGLKLCVCLGVGFLLTIPASVWLVPHLFPDPDGRFVPNMIAGGLLAMLALGSWVIWSIGDMDG